MRGVFDRVEVLKAKEEISFKSVTSFCKVEQESLKSLLQLELGSCLKNWVELFSKSGRRCIPELRMKLHIRVFKLDKSENSRHISHVLSSKNCMHRLNREKRLLQRIDHVSSCDEVRAFLLALAEFELREVYLDYFLELSRLRNSVDIAVVGTKLDVPLKGSTHLTQVF